MKDLIQSYFNLGLGAFMGVLTAGIFFYVLLIKLFEIIFRKKFPAGWRYALGVIMPIMLLIPVKIATPWTFIPLINFNVPLYIKSPEPILLDGITEVKNYYTEAEASGEFLYTALYYIWFAGFAVTLIYQLIRLFSLKKRIAAKGLRCADRRYTDMLSDICREYKISVPKLVIFPETDTPFAIGALKPSIILPSENFTEKEIEYIFRHELMHIRRRDILIKLLLMIFRCACWFNPFAYIMCKKTFEDMEITCDERVSKGFSEEDREGYSKAILKGVSKLRYPAVTTYLSPTAKLTKSRIDAVMNVKKLGSMIPFVISFFSVLLLSQTVYAIPDNGNQLMFYYTDPYPMEKDPYIVTDKWRTCEAENAGEAGEKVFRQYMAMYMGDDVPDYYRIEDYYIQQANEVGKYKENPGLTDRIMTYTALGLYHPHTYAFVRYAVKTANQCGNTVHNTPFSYTSFANGYSDNVIICFELAHEGNTYTAVNIGIAGGWGSTSYHFSNVLTREYGFMENADIYAKSGLLDYSWDCSENLPDKTDLCKANYLANKNLCERKNISQPAFPDGISFIWAGDAATRKYTASADCVEEGVGIKGDDFVYLDKGFEYCGYDADLEKAEITVYGNVTGDNPHGVIFRARNASESFMRVVKLYAVEVTDTLFTPYVFHDNFESIAIPEELTEASSILEYMKTPRNGSDFTVMDYKNITVKEDGVYADVKFKGRLEGIYSSDLEEGNEYICCKVR